jgi:hypothetical protein
LHFFLLPFSLFLPLASQFGLWFVATITAWFSIRRVGVDFGGKY